jgi:hypothetical protein
MTGQSFHAFEERSALKVRDQNIFCQVVSNYPKKQTPILFEQIQRVSMPSYDTTWSLPLYRNISLLSKPSSYDPRWDTTNEDDSNCDGYIDLPEDFIPPRHDFSRKPRRKEAPKPAPTEETPLPDGLVHLHDMDVVCGRGAPTLVHPGNQAYRNVIQKYAASYLCAKRSDKPVIATKVMETMKIRAVRFVRRERHHTGLGWIVLNDNKVYEKVCQSLREGAPELRRKMLASDSRKRAERLLPFTEPLHDQENRSPTIYSV